jgi:hypothetical protein
LLLVVMVLVVVVVVVLRCHLKVPHNSIESQSGHHKQLLPRRKKFFE